LEATKVNSLRVEGLRIYLLQSEKFIAGGKAAYPALRKHFKDSDDENSLQVINQVCRADNALEGPITGADNRYMRT
jgi:hypothetical protein